MARLTRRDFGKLTAAAGAGIITATAVNTPARAEASWRITGTAVDALSSFDTEMTAFMQARSITAGQVAVTYQGRLVLARGYTHSDNGALPQVQPTSLFRIASVSKTITAAAIMRLVQDGRLSLSTPVTSLLTFTPLPGQTVDSRLSLVTVKRLLQHLGGWDRDISGDPNFEDKIITDALGKSLPMLHADEIRYVAGQPLDYDPGTTPPNPPGVTPTQKLLYSNYGYLLLGRIIEKVSGQSYETYVKQNLLSPLNITRMALGSTVTPHAGETLYETSKLNQATVLDGSGAYVPLPYGTFNMTIQDANGGWIASAPDLVKWAKMFDAPTVLNSNSLASIWEVPETGINSDNYYYGLGWYVRNAGTGRNTWHSGSMPGTFSLLVRTYSNLSWAAVFNRRDDPADPNGTTYGDIDGALWNAANAVRAWPSHDFFPMYF